MMNGNSLTCRQARARLVQALRSESPQALDADLRAHLAECPVCQTALRLMQAFALASLPETIECARCEEDLAAFVEREREEGASGAIRAFPHVWWHLWSCEDCLETYDMLRALVAAEGRGEIATPSPAASAPPRMRPVLHLPRQFLRHVLPAPGSPFAVMRGGSEGPLLVSEGPIEPEHHMALTVEEQPDHNWTVAVHITPALAGALALTLGTAVFRAPIDEAGGAAFADVPAALLAATDGPDLVVSVEDGAGASARE